MNPTTFLYNQIQVYSAHPRILALGYKNAFSVLHVKRLAVFQHHAQIHNLERSPGEFMHTKFAMQRQ